jgi:hypothetical protein
MNEILRGFDFCFAYIDHILVYSRTPEEHVQYIRTLFRQVQVHGIWLNSGKCLSSQIHKDLADSTHDFLRQNAVRRPLNTLYSGPYKAMALTKTLRMAMNGRPVTVSTEG